MYMNQIERYILKKIFKRLTIQSPAHYGNIVEVLQLIIAAQKNEFTEDNHPTLRRFIKDQLNEAMNNELK